MHMYIHHYTHTYLYFLSCMGHVCRNISLDRLKEGKHSMELNVPFYCHSFKFVSWSQNAALLFHWFSYQDPHRHLGALSTVFSCDSLQICQGWPRSHVNHWSPLRMARLKHPWHFIPPFCSILLSSSFILYFFRYWKSWTVFHSCSILPWSWFCLWIGLPTLIEALLELLVALIS